MKWTSAFSDKESFEDNIRYCISQLERQLPSEPNIIFVYYGTYFSNFASEIFSALDKAFPSASIAGCGAAAMMSGLEELSDSTCISIMAGILPDVKVQLSHLDVVYEPGLDASPQDWYKFTGIPKEFNQSFIVLADPYSANVENVLQGLDYAYNAPIIGGFSSGVEFKGKTSLLCNETIHSHGVVLVSLSGRIDVIPLVAQGCRPIGDDLTISECNEVVLEKIGDKSPMLCLKGIAENLNETDKALLHKSLFLGVEMDTLSIDPDSREYLIRNIRGINPENGALVVGDHLQKGQNVRFHIRDPESSREELSSMVSRYKTKLQSRDCTGIMVFSCLGRLADFYGEQSVDASIINSVSEESPLSGFFCSGEIGPVQGSTYIHGYTASVALFFEPVK